MAEAAEETGLPTSTENFADLLEESFAGDARLFGKVVTGSVVSVENDFAIVDVGLKSEGTVPIREFRGADGDINVNIGDDVDVFVERFEDRNGVVILSRDKARREEAWTVLEKAFENQERVNGIIFGRVKGGFTVDLAGAVAFLPGSQVDIRPVRDASSLMGSPQPFQILKMDRSRGNIVISRRAVLEETRAEERSELISNLEEGQVLEGVVKNITDYGAFVDLGGIDGLLHVTDIAWKRINHPSEALQIGQTVNVQVIRFNIENQRISLGMKQLESDPWDGVELKYPIQTKFNGRITNITDYGAFVELEEGIEGLVHVSEMSWTKKNVHPGKIVSTSQEVEVMVLDVDPTKRRISLGLKQCMSNPWLEFQDDSKVGSTVEGEIKNITEFGLFIGLTEDIDGMVHMSDLDWMVAGEEAIAAYNKGDMIKVKILDIDVEKERISLGVKQLTDDPVSSSLEKIKKGDVVTCKITKVVDNGIEVLVGDEIAGFIRRSDLSRDRSEQRPDRFAAGEVVDAKVTSVDRATRKIGLSVKAREVQEEKVAMAAYGSSDSGASLGDILGAALKEKSEAEDSADDDDAEDAAEVEAEEATPEEEAAPEAEAKEGDAVAEVEAKPAKKK
ncbi:MAG: 30S ribosomal protein S1, partial [Rhodospirillaceae bacterium]|nr:30S ribosomal protein S1 [Rhodospirillaceae bacterium]